MPVDVVFRDVEKRRRIAPEGMRRIELEARELKHPEVGKFARVLSLQKLRHGIGTDVPGSNGSEARRFADFCREARRGRLAVRPGNADHFRRVAAGLAEVRELLCEEFNFPRNRNAGLSCG